MPDVSQRFSGQVPVRLDGRPDMGPLAGVTRWRGVRDFEHSTLCRAFGLDQATFYFDLPSTCRGVGSMRGEHDAQRRIINGYVMHAAYKEPVGKLTIVRDGNKFRDDDPTSARDFLDLSRT